MNRVLGREGGGRDERKGEQGAGGSGGMGGSWPQALSHWLARWFPPLLASAKFKELPVTWQ